MAKTFRRSIIQRPPPTANRALLRPTNSKLRFKVLPSLREYWKLRKQYLATLQKLLDKPELGENEPEIKRLENYRLLRESYMGRIINWYFIPLFVFFLAISCFYLFHPNGTTHISASLDVLSVNFKTFRNYEFSKSDIESKGNLGRVITYNGLTTDDDGNSYDQQVRVEAGNNKEIRLESLTIPAGAKVSFYHPIKEELHLVVAHKNAKERITGSYSIAEGALYSNVEKRFSKDITDSTRRHEINFTKSFNDRNTFDFAMVGQNSIQFPALYISDFSSFNEYNALHDMPTSSIVSGTIRLLDTNNDTITFHRGDSLSLSFSERPVNVFLKVNDDVIHLEFEAEVKKLIAGPSILSTSESLNRMPWRIKTLYDKVPYAWALLIALFPFLVTLFFRQQKNI